MAIVVSLGIFECGEYLTIVNVDAAIKLIARIRQRQIIVRDANRIHHFIQMENVLVKIISESCYTVDFVNKDLILNDI